MERAAPPPLAGWTGTQQAKDSPLLVTSRAQPVENLHRLRRQLVLTARLAALARRCIAGNDTPSGGTDADKFVFDTALNALANVDERGRTVTAFFEWIPAAARIYIFRYNVPAG
jgi:hypothetical protein